MSEIVFLRPRAACPRALGHSIFTEADAYEALREQVRDAVRVHFDDSNRPTVIRLS